MIMKAQVSNKKARDLLQNLEEVAEKLDVAVRYERLTQGPIRSHHGSCRLREQNMIVIDSRMGSSERLDALSRELARFDLENVFIPPAVRDLLLQCGATNRKQSP